MSVTKNLIGRYQFSLLEKLFRKGIFITKLMDSTEELNSFFRRIFPVKTQFELIRIGSNEDGGYVIPDDLTNITTCFSPGVSDNSTFELKLYENYGIISHMCDNSVDGPIIKCAGFKFNKKHINSFNDIDNMTFDSWVWENKKSGEDAILQMDIEGGEYDAIIHTDKGIFKEFKILIIEFHNFHNVLNKFGFRTISACFDKLLEDFMIVHVHPNNCGPVRKFKKYEIPTELEFTFLRKDRIKSYEFRQDFPHELDTDNVKGNPSIILPKNFYLN